jgi:hypothetical protein
MPEVCNVTELLATPNTESYYDLYDFELHRAPYSI